MAESEARYRALYIRTPAMLQSIDNKGRLINVSNHWLMIMGYTREEVIGQSVGSFLTEKSINYAKKQILPEFLRTGYCHEVPYQFVKRNGQIIDVLASAIAERDAEGRIMHSLAVLVVLLLGAGLLLVVGFGVGAAALGSFNVPVPKKIISWMI